MVRGIFWLGLLLVFCWLAWMGWNEYQKVEAYQRWAKQFDKAKYDIYAVLGLKDTTVTWGKPTRSEPTNLQSFSLKDVEAIHIMVDGQTVELDNLPTKGKTALVFILTHNATAIEIPFTEISMAAEWGKYLQSFL